MVEYPSAQAGSMVHQATVFGTTATRYPCFWYTQSRRPCLCRASKPLLPCGASTRSLRMRYRWPCPIAMPFSDVIVPKPPDKSQSSSQPGGVLTPDAPDSVARRSCLTWIDGLPGVPRIAVQKRLGAVSAESRPPGRSSLFVARRELECAERAIGWETKRRPGPDRLPSKPRWSPIQWHPMACSPRGSAHRGCITSLGETVLLLQS